MSQLLDWVKSFWKRDEDRGSGEGQGPDLFEATYTQSQDRVMSVLPQTHDLPRILELVQPPHPARTAERRDYGPDPIAECTLTCTAERTFTCDDIRALLTRDRWEDAMKPSFYVTATDGLTTPLQASNAPAQGIAVKASWPMYEGSENTEQSVVVAAGKVAGWLASRPEIFRISEPVDPERASRQFAAAREIIAVRPEYVAIIAFPREEQDRFDGVDSWNTLHAMGLEWGDMDCFHWQDEVDRDHLFSIEVDDERFGYALPEEIAAGRQHFRALRFIFSPARSPAPMHVLQEMNRAALCFQSHTGCQLACSVDGEPVEDVNALDRAISEMVAAFTTFGVQPGSSSVCQLR